ncbi:Polyketide cyclase / dehydrase and lipid transport [Roseovarius azorensis]|uniref:Polyketide cyclase / dehydrase and lipid transport n=1 Tax=Roseovarius azorensis TaxID=1287727 RepID=A0A1H7RJX2_9RHOB|nr:SRPBCC family protein [Roseovarius azorensis]SEL60503.1 Polyketide cyclase / dehydrase and lipid transport [Roseovarius azorensis]
MRFTSKADIEAPIDHVFARITDFQTLERAALRRGAEVRRNDERASPGVGMGWHASFMLRGKRREIETELTEYNPPSGVTVLARSTLLSGRMDVDLVALSPGRTRMTVDLAVTPKTLAARLMVQSLKLARANLANRFRSRVAGYAVDLEERFRRGA